MPSPNQITPAQLSRLIGTPVCPVLIDVRIDTDFDTYPRMVPSSFHHPFDDVVSLVPELTHRRVVLICHEGKKLSEGAAAVLRNYQIRAEVLAGGYMGWQDSGHDLIKADQIPKRAAQGQTVWVTRHRPKIDRIACPWFIRRFVDPRAQFLFVPPAHVKDVAQRFHATPFDIEDVFWSHRGPLCSFDVMTREFEIKNEALSHLASIVRAADTSRHDLAPEAAGLLAISLGLSRMYRDDLEQLEAGMVIYDALYRWARDAQDESHDHSSALSSNPQT
ncbi:MAG: sulfurtransferase/chromate resistance protein [Pseudomonadota bacterium]